MVGELEYPKFLFKIFFNSVLRSKIVMVRNLENMSLLILKELAP